MKNKKLITILSLFLLVAMLVTSTPSFLNADTTGTNDAAPVGRELQADDFSFIDVFFGKSSNGQPVLPIEYSKDPEYLPTNLDTLLQSKATDNLTKSRYWVTGASTEGKDLHFSVVYNLTKISPDESKGLSVPAGKERLKAGDYFYIDMPPELSAFEFDATKRIITHPDDKKVKMAELSYEKKDGSAKSRRIKVTFLEGVEGRFKNNVRGTVWAQASTNANYFESDTRVVDFTISVPGKEKTLTATYIFANTNKKNEYLFKSGPYIVGYTGTKDYGQVFSYDLRVNIEQQPLGTIVVKDALKDENNEKKLLAGVEYIKESFTLKKLKYKYMDIDGKRGYTTTDAKEPGSAFIDNSSLLQHDENNADDPKLVFDDENKSFELTIPNVGKWSYLLQYKVTNPADGRLVKNGATIYKQEVGADNKTVLVPIDAYTDEKGAIVKESGTSAYLKTVSGASVTSEPGKVKLIISKVGSNNNVPLKDVEFTLVSEDRTETPLPLTSEYGVTSVFVKPGTYQLLEKSTPAGYKPLKTPYEVIIPKQTEPYTIQVVNEAEAVQPKTVNVEIVKVCKVDPNNSSVPQTPASEDKGADVTLVLERRLAKDNPSAPDNPFETVAGQADIVLAQGSASVLLENLAKTNDEGKAYEYRVVEKVVAGQTPVLSPTDVTVAPEENGKIVITVAKDCSAPKAPEVVEKVTVKALLVCKIDPSKPGEQTPITEDKGGEITLELQRKLEGEKDTEFKAVEGKVVPQGTSEVTFNEVDKTNGTTAYVYRVVAKDDKAMETKTIVSPDKTKIEVTLAKDCAQKEEPKKEEPKLPVENKPEDPKKEEPKTEEPSETPSSNEGSGTVSKVERNETPVTSSENTPNNPKPGVTTEGTAVEKNETEVLPGSVPSQSSTNASNNKTAVNPANKKLPKTGEGLNAAAYAVIALLGGASLVAYGVFRKKKFQ